MAIKGNLREFIWEVSHFFIKEEKRKNHIKVMA